MLKVKYKIRERWELETALHIIKVQITEMAIPS